MQSEHTEHMGEELMTDYQFKCYKEARDEKDATLRHEIAALKEKCAALEKENALLRVSQGCNSENGMSDYQFKYIMDLKGENAALKKELEALRAKNQVE